MAIKYFGCHENLFNLIKGMQMVRNKKTGAGLALIAAVLGSSVCGSALALPEMDVGSVPPFVAPDSVNTVDSTVAEPLDVDKQPNAS